MNATRITRWGLGARLAGASALLALALLAPQAQAADSTVRIKLARSHAAATSAAGPTVLRLDGEDGPNSLAVGLTQNRTKFLITNSGGFNDVRPPCERVQGSTTQVTCPTAGIKLIQGSLGGGHDMFGISEEITLPSIIKGGRGADRLIGGSGIDSFLGGPGRDRLWGRFGDDLLRGGKGKDWLFGGAGADALRGGPGADRLKGGPGPDQLHGGAGKDRQRQ